MESGEALKAHVPWGGAVRSGRPSLPPIWELPRLSCQCSLERAANGGDSWVKDKSHKHLSINDMECGGEGGIRTLHFFVFSYGYEGIESESCLAAAEEF